MTPRSIRRAAQRSAEREARRANKLIIKTAALSGAPNTPAISEAQLTANRENAQFSTGPITEAGKAKSSLNAVKSGLTGRTVLLPTDDADRYQAHVQSYEANFQPVGPEELALVQSLADTRWRLGRIPCLEMAIYAQGYIEFAEDFEEQDEAIRPALIEAHTYLAYEKQIRNLYLQEARLVRRREKEIMELHRLQQERIAKEARKLEAALSQIRKPAAPSSSPEIGFEFSTNEQEPLTAPQSQQILPAFATLPGLPVAA